MRKTQEKAERIVAPHPRFMDCPSGAEENENAHVAGIIEKVLAMIGGKWKVLIVFHLGTSGMLRFGELRKMIPGVTQKMLTAALREMERDGLLQRKVYAEVPPRVEYRLTDEGGDLKDVYVAVSGWGMKHARLLETISHPISDVPSEMLYEVA